MSWIALLLLTGLSGLPGDASTYRSLGTASAPVIEPVKVRLLANAQVSAGEVLLRDVATISGGDAVRRLSIEKVVVVEHLSSSAKLTVESVRTRVRGAGYLPSEVEYAGSTAVELTVSGPRGGTRGKATTHFRSMDQWEEEVLRMIRAHLEQSTEWPIAQLRVSIVNKSVLEVLEKMQPTQFELVAPPHWNLGNQRVTLELRETNLSADYVLQVRVELERMVVVARRQILRDAAITIDDLDIVRTVVSQDDSHLAHDPSELLGKVALRVIEVDQPVCLNETKSPPLVFRSAPVTVRVLFGTAMIEITAVAKEEGGLGDWIEVYNPTTRQPLENKVQVVGFQQAILPPKAPPSRTASTYRPPVNRKGRP